MEADEPVDALDFYDDLVLDDQVGTVLADDHTFVKNRNGDLPHERETDFLEIDTKGSFVGRFEQTRTEAAMHLDGATDDAMSEWVTFAVANMLVHINLCASVPAQKIPRRYAAPSSVTR